MTNLLETEPETQANIEKENIRTHFVCNLCGCSCTLSRDGRYLRDENDDLYSNSLTIDDCIAGIAIKREVMSVKRARELIRGAEGKLVSKFSK